MEKLRRGKPAVKVAKKHSEVCLEKSALGGLFDNININGGWDIQMWASLSKAYATRRRMWGMPSTAAPSRCCHCMPLVAGACKLLP